MDYARAEFVFGCLHTRRRESPPRGPDPARGEPGVYVATRARTRGVHERLAPVRERGPPFAHASKCVNGHSPFTHGWGLLHPFARGSLMNRGLPPLRLCAIAIASSRPGCTRTTRSRARLLPCPMRARSLPAARYRPPQTRFGGGPPPACNYEHPDHHSPGATTLRLRRA